MQKLHGIQNNSYIFILNFHSYQLCVCECVGISKYGQLTRTCNNLQLPLPYFSIFVIFIKRTQSVCQFCRTWLLTRFSGKKCGPCSLCKQVSLQSYVTVSWKPAMQRIFLSSTLPPNRALRFGACLRSRHTPNKREITVLLCTSIAFLYTTHEPEIYEMDLNAKVKLVSNFVVDNKYRFFDA